MRIQDRYPRKPELPPSISGWRLAPIAVLTLAFLLSSGCCAVREGSDRGQRILESPGIRPAKLFAVVGAIPGSAIGLPLSILCLPTLPFKDLRYLSSPEHDISMPILFAPLDYGIGLCAFVLSSPFLLFHPELGTPRDLSEWPPARESRAEMGPGLSSARAVETIYPPPAPPNPPPLPPSPPIAPEDPSAASEASPAKASPENAVPPPPEKSSSPPQAGEKD